MNEDIHFERRGGELIRSFATGPPRKGARATAAMHSAAVAWRAFGDGSGGVGDPSIAVDPFVPAR